MRIEFDAEEEITPIAVASALINHTTQYGDSPIMLSLFPNGCCQTFDVDDLQQIAEHLLVYCMHNKESEE